MGNQGVHSVLCVQQQRLYACTTIHKTERSTVPGIMCGAGGGEGRNGDGRQKREEGRRVLIVQQGGGGWGRVQQQWFHICSAPSCAV